MSEEPKQPQGNNLPDESIDERIAQENIKKYLLENAEKTKPRQKGLSGFISANRNIILVFTAVFVIVLGAFLGYAIRQNSEQGTKIAQKEEMPEIERHVDFSVPDINDDGKIDQTDEEIAQEKLIEDKGTTVISDPEDEPDPVVTESASTEDITTPEAETSPDDITTGNVDDNLGDTSLPDAVKQPYDNVPDANDPDNETPGQGQTETPTPVTPTEPSTKPDANAATLSSLTVSAWNTLYSNSTSNVANGAAAIASNAQVIGFQELHSPNRRKAIRDKLLCSSCSYSGYVKDYSTSGSSPASLSIIWRKDLFTLNSSGYYKVSGGMGVKSSAGSRISAKWITWVKLRDKKSNKLFYFLNTHTVASVESSGKPRGGEGDRLRNYVTHMNILTAKVSTFQKEKIPIFIVGDFNVNYRYDSKVQYKDFPYTRLGKIGVRSNWQRLNLAGISKGSGTHGGGSRIIDYAYSADNKEVVPVSASISKSKYGSDHAPVYMSANFVSSSSSPSTSSNVNTAYSNSASTNVTTSSPTVSFDGINNFRDAAASSGSFKSGVLYRSARLYSATSSDVSKLSKTLGSGGLIVDLRTSGTRSSYPDKAIPGTTRLDASMTGTTNYTTFVTKQSDRQSINKAITAIAQTKGKVLIHCTAGKDRTGWTVAMIMHILGANDQQIMKEYLLSSSFGSVKSSWLNAGLAKARADYGSVDGYLKKGVGLSDATITALKNKLKG